MGRRCSHGVFALPRLRAFGRHHGLRLLLTLERLVGAAMGRKRVLATICWRFPVYSHGFVYQELLGLQQHVGAVRILYCEPGGRAALGCGFGALWRRRRRMVGDGSVSARDLAYFRRRAPGRVAGVLRRLADNAGLSAAAIEQHAHVLQAFTFTRLAAAYRPHYLHSYFFYESTLFARVAAEMLDIPRGVSCYADHLLADYELKMVRAQLAGATLAVATSGRIAAELQAILDGAADQVLIKPNAVDARFWVPSPARVPGGPPLHVVCVGRFDPKKGLLDLIEAMALLIRRGVRVRATLVGGADPGSAAGQAYADGLVARIAALGLDRVVGLAGARPRLEVRAMLQAADIVALPSIERPDGDKDGIPTVLLEAMACGVPVVATDAGSIAEVLTSGMNGLLVVQSAPAALADAIARLACDPELRRRLGQAARATVLARFDISVCEPLLHARVRSILRGAA